MRPQLGNWVGSWVGCLVVQSLQVIERIGRGEWIRTTGLLVPNQALYQAEPRPEDPSLTDYQDGLTPLDMPPAAGT